MGQASQELAITYELRLDTFQKRGAKWKVKVGPDALARAGFYLAPRRDQPGTTKCFFCKIEVCNWEDGEDPVQEHLRLAPDCHWVRVVGGQDCTLDDRLATFDGWPHAEDENVAPLSLAQAGFFYNPSSPNDDTAECAFCHVCFNQWTPEDDPLAVHREAKGQCEYLQQYDTSSLMSLGEVPVPVLAPPKLSVVPEESEEVETERENELQEEVPVVDLHDSKAGASIVDISEGSAFEESESDEELHAAPKARSVSPGTRSGPQRSPQRSPRRSPQAAQAHRSPTATSTATITSTAANESAGHSLKPQESLIELVEPQESLASELDPESAVGSPGEPLAPESPSPQRSRGGLLNGPFAGPRESSQGPLRGSPRGSISMVTVDYEEVSVESTTVSSGSANFSNNENDPETPQDVAVTPSGTPAHTAHPMAAPPLSILRSTFTSTPFGRANPNSILSHPMPSPLPDLGRQSFGNTNESCSQFGRSPVLYPRLPSFPKEFSSPTPPSKLDSKLGDEQSVSIYHSAADASTPSPQRSPLQRLDSSRLDSRMDSPLNSRLDSSMRESHDSYRSLLCRTASPPSFEQTTDTRPLVLSVPTKQELAKEWEDYLPQSTVEFLLSAKHQTVKEWQQLLAGEVGKQIRRITAQAVETLEVERARVIQSIREQYEN